MQNYKKIMTSIINSQPDDASYEEIMRELAFERMIERGIQDSTKNRLISSKAMEERISAWQK